MYHSPATDNIYVLVKQYMAIFFAHIWAIVAIVFFALMIGVVSTITSPEEYTSVTTVNFDLKNTNPFSQGGAVDGGFIATQVDLIASKTVAQRVVDNFSEEDFERVKHSIWDDYTLVDSLMSWMTDKVISFTDQNAAVEEELVEENILSETPVSVGDDSLTKRNVEYSWLTGAILARLNVIPVIGSSNITLKYESIDPYVASLVVNALATEFTEYSLERSTQPAERTKAWLDTQLDALRTRLEDAQNKLTEYQQETRIVATDDKLGVEEVKLEQLTAQLSSRQGEAKVLESRWQQIKASKGSALNTIPQIINAPTIQSIKAEIRRLEGQLTEVSSKFGENHPQYKSVIAELKSSRQKFSREVRAIASSAEKEAKLAKQTELRVSKALDEQKSLVLQLKNQKDEINVLQREVDSQRQTYNAALSQYNQSNLQSLVSQANVSVVDYATTPKYPSGPSLIKNIVASFVLGLILAAGLVFLKEFFSRKIRCQEDVFIDKDIHLLGVISR